MRRYPRELPNNFDENRSTDRPRSPRSNHRPKYSSRVPPENQANPQFYGNYNPGRRSKQKIPYGQQHMQRTTYVPEVNEPYVYFPVIYVSPTMMQPEEAMPDNYYARLPQTSSFRPSTPKYANYPEQPYPYTEYFDENGNSYVQYRGLYPSMPYYNYEQVEEVAENPNFALPDNAAQGNWQYCTTIPERKCQKSVHINMDDPTRTDVPVRQKGVKTKLRATNLKKLMTNSSQTAFIERPQAAMVPDREDKYESRSSQTNPEETKVKLATIATQTKVSKPKSGLFSCVQKKTEPKLEGLVIHVSSSEDYYKNSAAKPNESETVPKDEEFPSMPQPSIIQTTSMPENSVNPSSKSSLNENSNPDNQQSEDGSTK